MMQESRGFVSSKGAEKNNCRQYRQHKSNLKERKHSSSHCLRNCLRFCFKEQTAEQTGAMMDPQPEPSPMPSPRSRTSTSSSPRAAAEGGLRELTSTWFIHTQAPLICHNGLFPSWFLGFISRKDAEDMMKDKQLGCFLIRLSDKALGYILSYRGRDRCRHFVINQRESGQFFVLGDSFGHNTVSELIEYFKERPIEPFGEYLTTSCFRAQNEVLYDTIRVSPKERPVAAVHALNAKQQGSDLLLSRNRRQNKTEDVPSLPRRNRHLESDSTFENPDLVCYAQVRTKKPRERQVNRPDNSSRPSSGYSEVELMDSRCRSMPLLLSSGEEQNYRLSVTPPLPSRATPSPPSASPEPPHRGPCSSSTPSPPSLRGPFGAPSPSAVRGPFGAPTPEPSPGRPLSALSLDLFQPGPQQSPYPGTRAEDGGVYAEVSGAHCSRADDTYEQIPGVGNPYEPVGLLRPKPEASARPVKNDKWKRLFPDVKKKR